MAETGFSRKILRRYARDADIELTSVRPKHRIKIKAARRGDWNVPDLVDSGHKGH